MSWEQHDDDCPGCRPVLLDPATGKKSPDDSPEMVALIRIWNATTSEERHAFHRFTCQNSRDPQDIAVMQNLSERIQTALAQT